MNIFVKWHIPFIGCPFQNERLRIVICKIMSMDGMHNLFVMENISRFILSNAKLLSGNLIQELFIYVWHDKMLDTWFFFGIIYCKMIFDLLLRAKHTISPSMQSLMDLT